MVKSNSRFLQLDWLAFTFKPKTEILEPGFYFPTQFLNYFPELVDVFRDCIDSTKIFRSNYSHVLSYNQGDLIIGFNTVEPDASLTDVQKVLNSGLNVQVPSHSLAFFFDLFDIDISSDSAVPDMIDLLSSRFCSLSRIDLCFDDFSKTFTTDFYRRAWSDNRIQSPYINSIMVIGSIGKGFTFYAGSLKKRTKLLRIYDKFLQSKDLEHFVDSVRYEFELHGDQAKAIQKMICNEYRDGIPFAEFFYNWIKVKDHSTPSGDLRDVPCDEEWEMFLKDGFYEQLLPIRVVPDKKDVAHETLKRQCEYQHFKDVASYIDVYGRDEFDRQIKKEKRRNENIMRLRYKLNGSNEWEKREDIYSVKFSSRAKVL